MNVCARDFVAMCALLPGQRRGEAPTNFLPCVGPVALARLSVDDQCVLRLRFYEQHEWGEIAWASDTNMLPSAGLG